MTLSAFNYIKYFQPSSVLGPVLNNCSVDDFSESSCPFYFVQHGQLKLILETG